MRCSSSYGCGTLLLRFIERDVTFVQLINSLSETMDSPTPEAVFNAYKTLNTDGKFDAFESLPAD